VFATASLLNTSLIFVGKAGSQPLAFSRKELRYRKLQTGVENTLAYYTTATITALKGL
jgi:hypothetical protein